MADVDDLPTTELFPAFVWTCDTCGRDNFERGITVAPESIDPDDLPQAANADEETIRRWIDAGGRGTWMTGPAAVKCPHCGAEYATEAP